MSCPLLKVPPIPCCMNMEFLNNKFDADKTLCNIYQKLSSVKKLPIERLSAHLFIHMDDIIINNAILRSNEYNNVTRIVRLKYSLR